MKVAGAVLAFGLSLTSAVAWNENNLERWCLDVKKIKVQTGSVAKEQLFNGLAVSNLEGTADDEWVKYVEAAPEHGEFEASVAFKVPSHIDLETVMRVSSSMNFRGGKAKRTKNLWVVQVQNLHSHEWETLLSNKKIKTWKWSTVSSPLQALHEDVSEYVDTHDSTMTVRIYVPGKATDVALFDSISLCLDYMPVQEQVCLSLTGPHVNVLTGKVPLVQQAGGILAQQPALEGTVDDKYWQYVECMPEHKEFDGLLNFRIPSTLDVDRVTSVVARVNFRGEQCTKKRDLWNLELGSNLDKSYRERLWRNVDNKAWEWTAVEEETTLNKPFGEYLNDDGTLDVRLYTVNKATQAGLFDYIRVCLNIEAEPVRSPEPTVEVTMAWPTTSPTRTYKPTTKPTSKTKTPSAKPTPRPTVNRPRTNENTYCFGENEFLMLDAHKGQVDHPGDQTKGLKWNGHTGTEQPVWSSYVECAPNNDGVFEGVVKINVPKHLDQTRIEGATTYVNFQGEPAKKKKNKWVVRVTPVTGQKYEELWNNKHVTPWTWAAAESTWYFTKPFEEYCDEFDVISLEVRGTGCNENALFDYIEVCLHLTPLH